MFGLIVLSLRDLRKGDKVAVYYSFHFARDHWRVQQIEQMGALEGQPILNAQDWEKVKAKGAKAIEKWINDNMSHKSAVVVLIGAQTANRPWVRHEIIKGWSDKRKLVGIRIHGLKDGKGNTDAAGANPFEKIELDNGYTMASYVPVHNPAGADSKAVYASIQKNLKTWVEGGYKPG